MISNRSICCCEEMKYGFPLRKKEAEKVFLTQGWEYRFESAGVFRSDGISEFSCFCWHLPLSDLPHPPTFHAFFGLFQDLKQCRSFGCYCRCVQSQFSCQLFISSFSAAILIICGVDIKAWATWWAWHGCQLRVRTVLFYNYSNQTVLKLNTYRGTIYTRVTWVSWISL